MSLDVEVWVLGRDGAPDRVVPDLGDYAITPIAGDVGSVSIDYPRDGRNFAALRALVDEDRPIELEIRTDGTTANALGALLFTAAGDDIAAGDTWTFTGYTLEVLLRRARLPFNGDPAQGGNDKGETSFSANAGVVMRTLMQRAQARGTLTDIGFGSFSNTHDSNGVPWARTAVITLAPGRTYADILATTLHANELCEWELTRDRQLRLYNPGSRGVDRTNPGPEQLTLEHGRDLEDAPVRHDVTEIISHLTAAGKDGLYTEAENATAEARIGARVEGYVSFGDVADPGTLDAAAQLAVSAGGDGESEFTHGLILESEESEDHPVPGRDFRLSDWVLRAVNGTTARRRVVRYTLSRKGRELRAAVTLGDVIAARAIRVQRAIDALTNGSTVVGASAPPPDVDDGKAPAAPEGVTATSRAYYDGGTPQAQVTAAWLAVIENADGTAIGDLSGYEVQFRYLPGQPGNLPEDWQTAGITSSTSLRWSPVVQGKAVEVRVLAYDRYARDSAWSAVFPLTTATDAEAPPVPAAALVSSYLGLIAVECTGKGSAGQAMPGDFGVFEVHISTTPNFTVDRPLLAAGQIDAALSTTYVDRLTGAGTLPIPVGTAYGTTFYVRLVAVDRTGNASAASAIASAVLQQVKDGDVAGLSIGKLTAGIMSALMTVSGIIRTAAAGSRVELDTNGLRCIAADGRILFEFSIPNSLLTIVGRIIAGAGVGVGATVVINPTTAAIELYPNATQARIRQRAFTGTDPGGAANVPQFDLQVLNSSGVANGPIFALSGTNVWLFHQNGGSQSGGQLFLGGPGQPNGAIVRYVDGNNVSSGFRAQTDGRVDMESKKGRPAVIDAGSTGDILLQGVRNIRLDASSQVTSTVPLGSLGSGFSFHCQGGAQGGQRFAASQGILRFVDNDSNQFLSDGAGGLKSFVIDHPTDPDRWLVHACTEGPSGGVEYHGVADIVDHAAVVELPDYFEAATRPDGRQVQVTAVLPEQPADTPAVEPVWPAHGPASPEQPGALDPGRIGVPTIPEWAQLPTVAASYPRDGRFRVASSKPTGRVAWRVFAVRADVDPLDAEPLRSAVDPHGTGPYRYLTTRREAA